MRTDMKLKRFAVVVVCMLCLASAFAQSQNTGAQTLNQEMSGLAGKLNKALVAQKFTNVAAVDFTDLQGQPTELGRFLSEQLTVEMVLTEGVSMLDRANIKSILAEHKLTEEGLVKPENAKKLGEFAGVDAILIGNVTALDEGIVLMVKAISTASAKIVAAGRITFPKTSEIQQLLNRGISSTASAAPATTTSAGGASSYRDATAIATKDIGSLRVVLKSVLPVKVKDRRTDQGLRGIRCSFDFINRETQRPLVVAANAEAGGDSNWGGGTALGDVLRTTLVDERGSVWKLAGSGLTGMGIVSPGSGENAQAISPTEIVSLLQRQDDTGKNTFEAGGIRYRFVWGTMTPVSPGQTVTIVMTFVQDGGETASGSPPSFFQIVSEIVVGVTTSGNKKSYSLQNLIFDRVGMPASP